MIDVSSPRTTPYPSDLTDEEWTRIEPLLPDEKRFGRHRVTNLREVASAINYRDQVRLSLAGCCRSISRLGAPFTVITAAGTARASCPSCGESSNAVPRQKPKPQQLHHRKRQSNPLRRRAESGIPQSILVQAEGGC